jgi:hypothetical protein
MPAMALTDVQEVDATTERARRSVSTAMKQRPLEAAS